MKNCSKLYLLILLSLASISLHSQIAINEAGSAPDASAVLDVASTEKGILIPRMSAAERDAITSPAAGLMVYVNDDSRFWVHNGLTWEKITAGNDSGWEVSGGDIITSADGSVGIGTSSPDSELEVANAGSYLYESSQIRVSLYSDGASSAPRFAFQRTHSPVLGDDTSSAAITFNGDILGRLSFAGIRMNGTSGSMSGAGWIEMIQKGGASSGGVPGQMRFVTSDGLGNRSERMVIDPDGNVGIGTLAPGEKLELAGNIYINSSEPMIHFGNNSGTTDRMIIRKNPSNFGEINVLSNEQLRLRTSDTDRLIIEANGGIDMQGNQLKSFRIENRTSDPASPAVGQMWIRTDL